MIEDIKKTFMDSASLLGDYQSISKTDLANGYLDAEEAGDEGLKNAYYSALMLRYWYKIYDYQRTSASCRLEIEDFVEWLEEAFDIVFRQKAYLAWRDPSGNLYGDPNGPDKVINRCLFSVRGMYYQYYNKDKRKVNYITDSIDRQVEAFGDAAEASKVETDSSDNSTIKTLIGMYLSKHQYVEALIMDGIANHDSYRMDISRHKVVEVNEETGEEEKYYTYNCDRCGFDERKLVKHLSHIDEDFMNWFSDYYQISDETKSFIYNKIKDLSNTKLYTCIKHTLEGAKTDPDVRNILLGY